jgi:hypothetical protein
MSGRSFATEGGIIGITSFTSTSEQNELTSIATGYQFPPDLNMWNLQPRGGVRAKSVGATRPQKLQSRASGADAYLRPRS